MRQKDASSSGVAEETPWTREYDREVVNAGDEDILAAITQGSHSADDEFDFDLANNNEDSGEGGADDAVDLRDEEAVRKQRQRLAKRSADETIFIESIKASVAASLDSGDNNGNSSNESSGGGDRVVAQTRPFGEYGGGGSIERGGGAVGREAEL